jgi:alkanesulfonate monooxygenase SsuD/methylene tetrahydromethanopterin reductase-like flavin-dependent oxidoreductase (luciferase family)
MVTFGMFSVLECPPPRVPQEVYAELLDLFAYGETLGFTHAWIAEHHFSDYGTIGGPPVFLAALAGRTTAMRLGPAVSVLPFHDPLRLAEDYAALDVISGGRLEFGAGRGYQPGEFAGFGIDMAEARDRFWESLEIIAKAWEGGPFSHRGRYYDFSELTVKPRPVQDPVPLYVASVSPETFDIVLERGHSIMGSLLTNSAKSLAPRMREFRDRLHQGQDAVLPILLPVYVGETMERAVADIEDEVMWYFNTVGKLLPGKDAQVDSSYAYFAKLGERTGNVEYARALQGWAVGDTERVAEFLVNLARASTANHFMCFFTMGAMEKGKAKASMERFAEDVMPAVLRELQTNPS